MAKTRVHELLGVEPGERFKCKRDSKTFYMGSCGVLWEENQNGVRISNAAMLASLINDPSLIIRRPVYTPDQIRVMRALVELGFRWVAKDEYGLWAFTDQPTPCDDRYWRLSSGFMSISTVKSRLDCIPDWTIPLDLLAALKDAVEAAVEYGAPFDEPLAQERRGMLGWEGMA